jgi:5-methylcytosine-specific restriction endonuclease McrA
MKAKAVEHKGGECTRCGYSKSLTALQFHHTDPSTKEFRVGSGNTVAWDKLVVELEKCELLCANCHAEVHEELDMA